MDIVSIAALDPERVDGIRGLLADLAASHGVRVLWAIENGSRAWGFHHRTAITTAASCISGP